MSLTRPVLLCAAALSLTACASFDPFQSPPPPTMAAPAPAPVTAPPPAANTPAPPAGAVDDTVNPGTPQSEVEEVVEAISRGTSPGRGGGGRGDIGRGDIGDIGGGIGASGR